MTDQDLHNTQADDLGAEFDSVLAEAPITARWCYSLESAIETTVRLLGEAGRDQQPRLDAHLERLLVLQLGYFTRCAEVRP